MDQTDSKSELTGSISRSSRASFSSSSSSKFIRKFSSLSLKSRKKAKTEPIVMSDQTNPSRDGFGLNTVFEPEEHSNIIADLVFVHGLGGGSSKTWCHPNDSEFFWPGQWLPHDSAFEGVRIHSFGYNANWASLQSSPLDVHAFGQSLVEELTNSPHIKDHDTSIILIGHSMGGLVIKKACILSKTTPGFRDVADRLHSFYFLGTPHRGSPLAATLGNILRVFGTGRRYVAGLEAKSELIRVLNDQFRMHYQGIDLHTFYETQPTPPLGLIVDIESATLGYAEERPQLLNASHRELTKFDGPEDSNYRSLRNRLATTIQQIREERGSSAMSPYTLVTSEQPAPFESTQERIDAVAQYLSVDNAPDDILLTLDDIRLKGSCSWLSTKSTFREWLRSDTPRYFWLKGPPACGKSVLASHVIDILRGQSTSYYFFKTGEKVSPNMSSFLRSMAYQMARQSPIIREALWQLSRQGPPIDTRNLKSIWHNIFTGCLFHKPLTQPHYWVIDALDEAFDGGTLDEYFVLLSKIDDEIPLKVFITSRSSIGLDNLFSGLPTITETVTPEDSLSDIRLYVKTLSATLPVHDSQERHNLVKKLVDKSGGSFLWTVLVMNQLRDPSVVTVEDVHGVLDRVPDKMSELYISNLRKLESSRTKTLAKHIITWAICSVRPLTLNQMKDAIKLSLDTTLSRDLRTSLQHLCGQFLDVNKQSQIQVVHETARSFLTMETLDSELRIDLPEGHRMIATACLKLLASEDFKYSKRRRSAVAINKLSISDYACLRFSEHIGRASSSSDELFNLLCEFFSTNVLSWIEYVVQLRDLDCLIRTSRHLTRYLMRRAKHVPLISGDLHTWAVDLPRIVTQFGVNLLNNPTAIHTLIPPFCPRNSAIYRQFGYAEDGIKLLGAWNAGWDDRICSISYHDTYATAVATIDQRFVVGLSDGLLKIYRTSTCEELTVLDHGESVSILQFGSTSKLLASASLKHIKLWETITGNELFSLRTESQTLAMAFNETEALLFLASRDKFISARRTSDGSLQHKFAWTDTFIDPSKEGGHHLTPNAVRISVEQQVMAVVYRSKPVQLWSLERQRPIGPCLRQSSNLKHNKAGHIVHSAILNPNPAYQRLVVSYWDDALVVFDTETCRPLISNMAGLDKIAISPNGKTIAGGDGTGSIKIYDSETLQFLHRVHVQGDYLTSLVFTTDNLRMIDIRGTQSNVWEAAILVSQDSYSNASEPSDSVHHPMEDTEAPLVDQSSEITTLYCCEENGIAFCGRSNGRIDTCSLGDPEKTMRNLYKHRGSFTGVTCFDWAHGPRIAISADSSGHFRVMQITTGTRREWSAQSLLEAKSEQGCAIRQVLLDPTGSFALISTSESDSLWSISRKERVAQLTERRRIIWKWFVRASRPTQLLLVEDTIVKLFDWSGLTQISSHDDGLSSTHQGGPTSSLASIDVDAISIASDGNELVLAQKVNHSKSELRVVSTRDDLLTTRVQIFDLLTLEPGPLNTMVPGKPAIPVPITHLAEIPNVDHIIGTVKRFNAWCLLFLSLGGWVCSIELNSASVDTFQKHFFIPSVWRTGNFTFIARVRRNQDIVFVHNDGLIVVKNGLDIGEHVSII